MERMRLLRFSDAAGVRSVSNGTELESRLGQGDGGPEGITDRELLRAYLEMKERPPERIELLLLHAEAIMEREEEL